jgi:hypothetical protein
MKCLVVCLNGVRVGFLSDAEDPTFAYDSEWLATGPGYALSRQLPLQANECSGLHAGACDSLEVAQQVRVDRQANRLAGFLLSVRYHFFSTRLASVRAMRWSGVPVR